MVLQVWDVVTYWEHEVGKYQKSIEYEIQELQQKLVDWIITEEEKEKLSLLK